jgi:hypothetical protein
MTSRKIKVHYPWLDTPAKGAFFVPTLKLQEVKEHGLKAALHNGIVGKAEFGTFEGKIGVLFTRVSPQ